MRTKALQSAYQNAWLAKRRRDWINANGPCCGCGSWQDLQVDHIDRATKVTHRVWSWSAARRESELAKCQVLCRICHRDKTWTVDFQRAACGTDASYKSGACRCADCTAAHSAAVAAWRAKRRVALADVTPIRRRGGAA